jgi:Cys-Gly metallodipeptidase DUG1
MLIYTSVSGDPAHRDDVIRMAYFLETQLKQYSVETQTVELGTHVIEGQSLKLPPLVLGRIGDDKSKKTILIYGHFDVQPVCRHLPRRNIFIPYLSL